MDTSPIKAALSDLERDLESARDARYQIECEKGGRPPKGGWEEPDTMFDRPMPLSAVGSVSMNNATIDDFCRYLEGHLDRPLIDETNLEGRFDLQVGDENPSAGDFIRRVRDQLGLVVTVAPRPVEMLVFRR